VESLKSITQRSAKSIRNYLQFQFQFEILKLHSKAPPNEEFLTQLQQAFIASEETISKFVKSCKWTQIAGDDEQNIGLASLRKEYDFNEVLIIDQDLNVLFSVAKNNDFGTNLKIDLSETHFTKSCIQAIDTARPVFSDLEFYEPSDAIVSFVIQGLINDSDEVIGLIAFQIDSHKFNETMADKISLGHAGEAYLVGSDFLMRSNPNPTDKISPVLNPDNKVKTELLQVWFQKHVNNINSFLKSPTSVAEITEDQVKTDILEYEGRGGYPVVGFVAVITEKPAAEVFATARSQRRISGYTMAVTILIVSMAAITITQRFATPMRKLSAWAIKVSDGDLIIRDIETPDNEIGLLNQSFQHMARSLQEEKIKNEQDRWLKTGYANLTESMRSQNSLADLSHSVITHLTRYFGAQVGALYITEPSGGLTLMGSYAIEIPMKKQRWNRVKVWLDKQQSNGKPWW